MRKRRCSGLPAVMAGSIVTAREDCGERRDSLIQVPTLQQQGRVHRGDASVQGPHSGQGCQVGDDPDVRRSAQASQHV